MDSRLDHIVWERLIVDFAVVDFQRQNLVVVAAVLVTVVKSKAS